MGCPRGHPDGKAKKAEAVSEPLSESVGVDQLDAETLVRINGAVQIGAGVLLAVGKFRRVAALALIGSIIPTTYAGHRFWEESDPTTRAQQKMHFLKNLGLLGGLILAAFDTEGEPSLGWRAKRQAREIETAIGVGRAKAQRAGKNLSLSSLVGSKSGTKTIRRGGRSAAVPASIWRLVSSWRRRLRPIPRSCGTPAKELPMHSGTRVERRARPCNRPLPSSRMPPVIWSRSPATWPIQDSMRSLRTLPRARSASTEALSKVREHLPVD